MDALWQALLDELGLEAELLEVSDGRVMMRMRFDDEQEPVVVTVTGTPEEWDAFFAWAGGEDDVAELVSSALGGREEGEDFLVVHRGRLRWSIREALPPLSMYRVQKQRIAARRAGAPQRRDWSTSAS